MRITLVLLALLVVIAVASYLRVTANPQQVDECDITKKQERAGLGCQ